MTKVTCFEDNSNVFGTLGKDNNGCDIDYESDQGDRGEDDDDEGVQGARHDQDDRDDDGDEDSHRSLED